VSEARRILEAAANSQGLAAAELLPLVYDELRRLATQKLQRELPGQTLQPTALVHEAYFRLVGTTMEPNWSGKGHFFAAAAEAMRRILVDNARRKHRLRHGGDAMRIDLKGDLDVGVPEPREDLIALDEALDKLKTVDGTAAELIQLRYFTGLTLSEAAEVLDISPRSADRTWAYAKAWLHREMT